MNKVILTGRLTRDPEIRYSAGENATCVARFSLAVNRRFHREGEQSADFINCVAFGKSGEFVEKYFHKGMKMDLEGHIQTGSYTNQDGKKVYTTDVIVEQVEFGESKKAGGETGASGYAATTGIPDKIPDIPEPDLSDDGLPFN